ncbi:MAG TPA: CHAT domain-containing protein [Waterburya sp.]|jgi:CHAT domain-containing protein
MFPKRRENNKRLIPSFLPLQRLNQKWLPHLFLVLMTALLCIIATPIFAKVTEVAPVVQNQSAQTQLLQQGKTLYEEGKFAEAATVWQQAAQVYQTQGDKLNQALALNYLCLAYQQLGQWKEAEGAIASSLNLLQQQPNPIPASLRLPVLAQALNTQGQLQLAQGQAQQALNTWKQATTTYTQVGDNSGIIGSLINQSQALQTLGLYRQAKKTLSDVEQALQNQPNTPIKVTGLRSLGNALRVIGDLDQSHQVLQQSLALAQQLNSPSDKSAVLLSLGNTARAQQHTPVAIDYYQQAAGASTTSLTRTQAQLNQLSLLEPKQLSEAQALASQIQTQLSNLPPSRAAVYAQINFAQSLTRLKQENSASTPSQTEIGQILARALQQAKGLNDLRAQAYALGQLGALYEQTQQWNNAKDLTEQALLIAQTNNAPDIAYRWQWQLGRLLKDTGNIKGAIAAYTEAVATLQSLRSDLVAINPDIQFSFREGVEPIYRQLVDLLLQSDGTSQPSQQNLIQARAVIESLQLAELDNFFRTACLAGKPVQIDQVIDRDDPTAAVVYPIILPDRLDVILKLPQQNLLHYKTTIAQSDVEKTIDDLRKELTRPFTVRTAQTISQTIYDWLLRPAEDALAQSQVKTLVFVLDGSLRNIPMAALYDGQQYLVQKYAVALTPGLQLLAPKSLKRTQLRALTGGLTEARQNFPPLQNVAIEVQEIQSEIPGKVLLNQDFTSTSFQREISSVPFPVVHLATHGQFSSNAEDTYILTWDGRINVNQLNEVLRRRDQSQSSAIELLVLSACKTAKGDKRAALGLAGVAVRAGARSTLASLWSVDDESTAVLMSQFYRELAHTTVNKAEALRQAQLFLLQDSRYRYPRYWAPFVLVGNWL